MVKNILSILSTRQNTILSGATILMVAIFGSKFLGLIRDRLLVYNFDTSTASIFFASFQLPELLFTVLIFSALSVAFIPTFTDYLNKKGEEEASEFASDILNLSLVFFTIVAVICAIFVGPLNSLVVPGFINGEQKLLTDQLTQIILGAQVILVVGSFFVGIGQSHQRFIIPAIAPLFYNLGTIFGIIVLTPFMGIAGPAVGTVIGSVLHVLVQIPLVRSLGFKYRFSFDFFNAGVREVVRLMSIRSIGLAIEQLNDTVGIALASLVSYSSVTLLTFAQHLQAVPIGLFGATIAQAALPVLAREHSKGEDESFKTTLLTTMHQILFLALPSTAILIVLRIPVVRLVFGSAQFNWNDTVLTGYTVALLSVGLAAQSVYLLLVRGFYALKDTKTPVIVSVVNVLINVSLSFLFVKYFELNVWSLGLADSIASIVGFVLILYFLNKKVGGLDMNKLLIPLFKMLLASLVAALALYIPIKALDQLVFDTTKTLNLFLLTGFASIFGLAVYVVLVWWMGVLELKTYVDLMYKIGEKLKVIGRVQQQIETEEILRETDRVV